MKFPNFFIVGAPKCGTTALYDYLRQHPDVFMSEWKEPHFFGSDLHAPHFLRDKEKYHELFNGAETQKRRGESSVWYLYSKKSAFEIHEFCSDARIIIMLRNPIDVMHSYHSQRLYNGTENFTDFMHALAAENDRKNGLLLPEDPWPIFGLFYREIVQFREQVARYLEVFPSKQVKIIVYEDFIATTTEVYRDVLQFLEIDPDFHAVIRPINTNKTYRNSWLRDLIYRPSPFERRFARMFFSKDSRKKITFFINQINRKEIARNPMPDDFRNELEREFLPEIMSLGQLIGRDLIHWCSTIKHDVSNK